MFTDTVLLWTLDPHNIIDTFCFIVLLSLLQLLLLLLLVMLILMSSSEYYPIRMWNKQQQHDGHTGGQVFDHRRLMQNDSAFFFSYLHALDFIIGKRFH